MSTKAGLKKRISVLDEKIAKLSAEREDCIKKLRAKESKPPSKILPVLFFIIFAFAAFYAVIVFSGFTLIEAFELLRLEFNNLLK